MEKLKPCPFCGGEAEIRYTGNNSGIYGYTSNIIMKSHPGLVMCRGCHISTIRYSRVCRAIERWNGRAGESNGS